MADPLLGKQLGDYVIQELLGRGGMARVYKGYDERLQRFAAVKVINSDNAPLADQAEYAERFRREARAIARLHHPNIVGVFQFGEYETNYYMAMVFVEGQDLRYILKENAEHGEKMPYDEVLNIIRGISSALDYAHSRGVIHRDIKPSNIMLDNENRAILTDFGLALNTQEGTLGDTFGSAHYIAPEQAVSSAKAVPQSDLYSLGVCIYEMLAGKVPFDDPSAMSVALKHLNDAPPPPRLFNPDLPPAAERVILKILDKDPNQRYENGALLTQALEQALFGDASESTFQMPVAKPTDISRSTTAIDPQRNAQKSTPVEAPLLNDDSDYAKHGRMRRAAGAEENVATTLGPAATPSFRSDSSLGQPPIKSTSAGASDNRTKLLIPIVAVLILLGGGAFFIANGGSGNSTPTNAPTSIAVVATSPATLEATSAATGDNTNTTDSQTAATSAATQASSVQPTKTKPPTKTAIPSKTNVPTKTATNVPPTKAPTATKTPSATKVPTSETVGAATNTDEARIVLTYDDYQFVLTNASSFIVDLDRLRFVQPGETETTTRSLDTTLWYAPGSQYTPRALPPRLCLQVYRNDRLQPTPSANCTEVFRAAWAKVAEGRRFWIADPGQSKSFQVFLADELLTTCEIAAGHCEFTVKR